MEIEHIFDSQVWQQINVARQCLEAAKMAANALKHRELSKAIDEVRLQVISLQEKCSKISKD